jgi:hypothetical protein
VNLEQLPRDQAEAARRYPSGSVGAAFQIYIRTPEWSARAQLTRDKIWWPAWFRIRDMWGDIAPDTITFEMMSKWRAGLLNLNENLPLSECRRCADLTASVPGVARHTLGRRRCPLGTSRATFCCVKTVFTRAIRSFLLTETIFRSSWKRSAYSVM